MTYSNDLKLKIQECIKSKKYTNAEIMKIFNISRSTFYKYKNNYSINNNIRKKKINLKI